MAILEVESLPELIRRAGSDFGDAPALDHAQRDGCSVSYGGLRDRVRRGGAALRARGLKAGDRVLLALESGPDWPTAFFSVLEAGLVAVPILMETPPQTAAAIAAHSGAKAMIFGKRNHAIDGLVSLEVEQLVEFEGLAAAQASPGSGDLAMLAFTSGSVQQPRAVELTHGNLTSNLNALLRVRQVEPGTSFLSILPPAHLFELMAGHLGPLACGARIVYAGPPLPNRIVDAMREHRISHAPAVPALVSCLYDEILDELIDGGLVDEERRHQSPTETIRRLESETEEGLERIRGGVRSRLGSSLQTLMVGGAAVDPNLVRVAKAVGVGMEFGYGLTEASPLVALGRCEECPTGSVGRPLPGIDVRLGDGGEIEVRGPNVTRGYYGNPAMTAAALKDGWLLTGDRGRFDDDGFLYVTGRIKEAMVTISGETIYPEEAEPWYEHSLFAEHCVSGAPGQDGNDSPTLFVVPMPDVADEELEAAYARLRAAAPSRLRVEGMIRLARPLPRTATGKVQRRLLIETIER